MSNDNKTTGEIIQDIADAIRNLGDHIRTNSVHAIDYGRFIEVSITFDQDNGGTMHETRFATNTVTPGDVVAWINTEAVKNA